MRASEHCLSGATFSARSALKLERNTRIKGSSPAGGNPLFSNRNFHFYRLRARLARTNFNIQLFAAILVAALGYFVDVYDIVIFSIVRRSSFTDLGLSIEDSAQYGIWILNLQMCGMLLGGLFWGMLGDRSGRLNVLFGSILLYSLANLANAFVNDIATYAALRFVAGIGLAGEVGAGITLVSELVSKERRGWATTFVATVGVTGALAASAAAEYLSWRGAYIVGGVLGLLLLALRVSVYESGLFVRLCAQREVVRGDIRTIFSNVARLRRYLSCIAIGAPFWVAFGIIVSFGPEFCVALGAREVPNVGRSIEWWTYGLALGDVGSGLLSQALRSRKRVLGVFIFLNICAFITALSAAGISAFQFYLICFALGFANGSWAVLLTTSAEQFGTNIRALAATTIPNFVRATAVPSILVFGLLRPHFGMLQATGVTALIFLIIAALGLWGVRESFGTDLNFVEE